MVTPTLRSVINATGVVIHTNLGRVPLSQPALEAMAAIGGGYSTLELNADSGGRGDRQDHIQGTLRELLGVEAAVVVNNNASAVLLALTALARGKEVIVSRSQAVEIGGGFASPMSCAEAGRVWSRSEPPIARTWAGLRAGDRRSHGGADARCIPAISG